MRLERQIEQLPVPLTQAELAAKGHELSEKLHEFAAADEDEKHRRKSAKAALDKLQEAIEELRDVVHAKAEKRPIHTTESPNTTDWTIEVYREDTGELVRSRPMTKAEREDAMQGQLFDVSPAPVDADEATG